jgi:hypothetical protein
MFDAPDSASYAPFTLNLKTGSLDDKLEQENKQLASTLHELFLRTEALRKFEGADTSEREAHHFRTALYFAAIARSKARDVLRERGFSV